MRRRGDDSEVLNVRVEESIRARRSAMDEIRALRGTPVPPRSAVARVAHDVAAARGRPVVLVVDDDRDVCAIWKRLLSADAEVWCAHSVAEARHAVGLAVRFACVVLDHGLPNGDGLEAGRYLRMADTDVPIYVVSGVLVEPGDPRRAAYESLGGPVSFAAKDERMAEGVRRHLSPSGGVPKT